MIAATGWTFANRARATAEKVSSLLHQENPANLAPEKRTETLDALSRQMAELPMEERLKARLDEGWKNWFAAMSEEEKRRFIEATLPGGLKQMLANFEKLPEAKRRRAISDALRDLKRIRELAASDEQSGIRVATNRPADPRAGAAAGPRERLVGLPRTRRRLTRLRVLTVIELLG